MMGGAWFDFRVFILCYHLWTSTLLKVEIEIIGNDHGLQGKPTINPFQC